ncbi:MAG: hypothetical protein FWE32_10730 [Oscillospiraceae bacterium]|nr:hypothetical protein [Oscillospiraceae bacterium]
MSLTKEDLQAIGQLMDTKLDPINKRLDGMDKRLDGMDKRLDGMDKRLDGMDKRLDGVDKRLNKLEGEMRKGFKDLTYCINMAGKDIAHIDETLRNHIDQPVH